MTIAARVHEAVARLMDAGVPADESRRDAALLARAVLGWDAAAWIARQHETAGDEFPRVFDSWIDRRCRREPVAYIIGEREFYGRPFRVTRAVLIPRPETELLVEEAIAALTALVGDERSASPLVVDVGTGSGCIAVTIALERPSARVIATEISEAALAVARDNADRLGVAGRVELRAGSLLAGLSAAPDLIVSNPPYVSAADRWSLPAEVRDYEPDLALFAGLDGLDVIRPLVAAAGRVLAPGGRLLIEIGAGQAAAVTRLVAETPGLALSRIRSDLQGIPRIVVARRE